MMESVLSSIPLTPSINLKTRNIKALEEYIGSNIRYITFAYYINAICSATSAKLLDLRTLSQTQPFNIERCALWRPKQLENRDNMCFKRDFSAHSENNVNNRTH